MSTISIEKYVDGICVEELQLPVAPLQFLAGLLPKRARRALWRHGVDLDALLNADEPGAAQWLDVKEGGVSKRVRISRRD